MVVGAPGLYASTANALLTETQLGAEAVLNTSLNLGNQSDATGELGGGPASPRHHNPAGWQGQALRSMQLKTDHLACAESGCESHPLLDTEAALLRQLRDLAIHLAHEQERLVHDFTAQLHHTVLASVDDSASCEVSAAAHQNVQDSMEPHPEDFPTQPSCSESVPDAENVLQQMQNRLFVMDVTDAEPEETSENRQTQTPGTDADLKKVLTSRSSVSGLFSESTWSEEEDPALGFVERQAPLLVAVYRWWMHKWWNKEEPPRTGRLAAFVASARFTWATVMAIGLNGILVIYQTDLAARRARAGHNDPIQTESSWEMLAEAFFVTYFGVELILKLAVHKLFFFCTQDMWWNVFDALTIVSAALELFIKIVSTSRGFDLGFLRVLRIFRLTRSLRIVRALHFVQGLRQLMDCIITSFANLIWCIILLLFLTGIFSVFLVQCTTLYWQDRKDTTTSTAVEEEHQELLLEAFGTVRQGMMSLFRVTSGGSDWGTYFEILEPTGVLGPLILIFYILFFMIAAWNIVTSLFLERALALAQPDIETQMLNKKRQDFADAKELMHIISLIDHDKSGTVSLGEFERYMNEPKFRQFLEFKEIDVKDAELFFSMLEASVHSEEIKLHVVVHGLMRMRGLATNLDLQALTFTLHSVYLAFDRNLEDLRIKMEQIDKEVRLVGKEVAGLPMRNGPFHWMWQSGSLFPSPRRRTSTAPALHDKLPTPSSTIEHTGGGQLSQLLVAGECSHVTQNI